MKRMKRLVSIIVVMSFIVSVFGVSAGAMTLTPNISTGGVEWRLLQGEKVTMGMKNGIPLTWIFLGYDASQNCRMILSTESMCYINKKESWANTIANYDQANPAVTWSENTFESWITSTSGFKSYFTTNERNKLVGDFGLLTDSELAIYGPGVLAPIGEGGSNWWIKKNPTDYSTSHARQYDYVYYASNGAQGQTFVYYNGGVGPTAKYYVRPTCTLRNDALVTRVAYASTATYTVVQGKDFTVPVMTEFAGTDNEGFGVTAAASTGNGYSNLSGKFTTSGVKIVTIEGNKVLFNVIPQPTDSSTATVTFS